jgi:ATP-dependent HslUV protease ATP-binding subunit HslU
VELQSLTVEDFVRILTEPKSSLTKQYTALLETEGLKLRFTKEALEEMARFAFRVNETTENIGARRLHTIMERVLDEISFMAPGHHEGPFRGRRSAGNCSIGRGKWRYRASAGKRSGDGPDGRERVVLIDPEYVRAMVASIVKDQDLSRYIL